MARSLALTALALGAVASAAQAQTQPAPAGDRYGPPPGAESPGNLYRAQPVQPGGAPRIRVLSWPGKVARTAAPVTVGALPTSPAPTPPGPAGAAPSYLAQAAYPRPVGAWTAYRTPAPAPVPSPSSQAGTPRQAAPPQAGPAAYASSGGWQPVFTAQATPRSVPTVAASAPPQAPPGYSPTAAAYRAAPPNRTLTADRRYGYDPTQDHSVRFYSVSRPFGLKPDPAPIPPQFFTATADLGADPPGPIPVNHVTATDRAAAVSGPDSGGQ